MVNVYNHKFNLHYNFCNNTKSFVKNHKINLLHVCLCVIISASPLKIKLAIWSLCSAYFSFQNLLKGTIFCVPTITSPKIL